jgi:hypothetical protein
MLHTAMYRASHRVVVSLKLLETVFAAPSMFNTTGDGYFPRFENFTPMDTLKDGQHKGFDIELVVRRGQS